MIRSFQSEGGTGNVQERCETGRRHVLSNADLPGSLRNRGVRRLLCAPPDDAMSLNEAYCTLARELFRKLPVFYWPETDKKETK